MTFKEFDHIFKVDSRFAALVVSDEQGTRAVNLTEHHRIIQSVDLINEAPPDVRAAFDRGRNILLYAYFSYELLVVGEAQAFAAFEIALKHRLASHPVGGQQTLRNLVDRARRVGILPRAQVISGGSMDPIEAIIHMRNALAHGTADIHSPGMALDVFQACAQQIDRLFSKSA